MSLIRFFPTTGEEMKEPMDIQDYRNLLNPKKLRWVFNPWTGAERRETDICRDPYGVTLVDPEPPRYQYPLLKYSPITGLKFNPNSRRTTAAQYRGELPRQTWIYNPWTGTARDQRDIDSDPTGLLIIPPGEPFIASGPIYPEDVGQPLPESPTPIQSHPLYAPLIDAINQARSGKGERHGGDTIPFTSQQWVGIARDHGIGFLTGQAVKKLNEAAAGKKGEEFEREVLGAIVYAGMAILKHRGEV